MGVNEVSDRLVYKIQTDGTVNTNWVYFVPSGNLATRPTFYLNSDVVYVSGDGSQENPYRIA